MRASEHERVAGFFKALGDPIRVRILSLLWEFGELCVCDIETTLEISQSRASRHLATLKAADVLEDRREGSWAYYKIARPAHPAVRASLRELHRSLSDDPVTAADRERVAKRGERCATNTDR